MVNPTTWALEVSAEFRLEARKSLACEGRRMQTRRYLALARLHLCKLTLQADSALIGQTSKFLRDLLDLRRIAHWLSVSNEN